MDPNVLVTVTETSLVTDVTVYSDSDYECDVSDLCDEFESGAGDKRVPNGGITCDTATSTSRDTKVLVM